MTLNIPRTRSFTVLALLALLLLAQAIAQAHGYAHLRAGQREDGASSGGRLCAACCLAAVLTQTAGTGAAPPLDFTPVSGATPPGPEVLRPGSADFHAFRSRAPPERP